MKTKQKVEYWLKKHPFLRDNDNRLFANIWNEELKTFGISRDIRKHFLILVAQGKLTPAPSIKRARAKLQEENPEYRGEKYKTRNVLVSETKEGRHQLAAAHDVRLVRKVVADQAGVWQLDRFVAFPLLQVLDDFRLLLTPLPLKGHVGNVALIFFTNS